MNGALVVMQREQVHASLHALSQPLTVVSLALTLAQSATSDTERAFALDAALGECQRAMDSVRNLRALLEPSGGASPPYVETTASAAAPQWTVGGAA